MNRSDAVLVLTTVIGSTTVVLGEEILRTTPPFTILALRFTAAALLFALISRKSIFPLTRHAVIGGLCVGLTFGVGCGLLYFGLPHVRSGKANFLITLEVVIIPVLLFLWSRKIPLKRELIAIPIALAGLWLLTWGHSGALPFYDLLLLASAASYGLYAISLSHFSPHVNLSQLTFITLSTIGLVSASIGLISGSFQLANVGTRWIIIMSYLVVVGSIIRFLLQSWAQKTASSTRTALIFTLEPVMTTIMSVGLMGEVLSFKQVLGGVLILVAAIITTIK